MSNIVGGISAWNELVDSIFDVENRAKIEWSFGAIGSGDYTKIQKFVVLCGGQRTGKTTIINIARKMFGDSVLIRDDVDLTKVPRDSFLITSSNTPPDFGSEHAGISRRLLVVNTSGNVLSTESYRELVARINSELIAIENYCVQTYKDTIPA